MRTSGPAFPAADHTAPQHTQTGRGNRYRGVSVAVVEGELALPAAATQLRIAPTLVRRETDDASERIVLEADVAATELVVAME